MNQMLTQHPDGTPKYLIFNRNTRDALAEEMETDNPLNEIMVYMEDGSVFGLECTVDDSLVDGYIYIKFAE